MPRTRRAHIAHLTADDIRAALDQRQFGPEYTQCLTEQLEAMETTEHGRHDGNRVDGRDS